MMRRSPPPPPPSATVPAGGGRRSRRLAATVLVALLASAAAAAAAPAVPLTPAGGTTVETRRPTFTWSAATSTQPIERYEVRVQPGDVVVAEAAGDQTSAAANVDLPDDATVSWYVVAIDAGARQDSAALEVTVATPPAAPAITAGPSGPTTSSSPTFGWAGSRPASAWAVTDAGGATVQEGLAPAGGGQVTLTGPVPDGPYSFRVAQRNVLGVEGPPATRAFVVDTVAPGELTLVPGQPATSSATSRTFSWSGVEPGARVEWRLVGAGGVVQGPSAGAGGVTALNAVALGSYVFQARQVDPAGNAGQWAGAPFAVLPPPAPTASGSATAGTAMRLPSTNWKRLKPRRGARITSRRPVLRWKKGSRRTTLYNVQVFRVRTGGRLKKVYSTFPRRSRLRLPRRARLARGACYVWRVWPFIGSRSTARPLGVSHFCVRRRR